MKTINYRSLGKGEKATNIEPKELRAETCDDVIYYRINYKK